MHKRLHLKKKYFLLAAGLTAMLNVSPEPARADTGEITLITQKECNSTLKEICQSIRIKTSLPEEELDFTSLTLYFLNEAEGVYYQAQIEDVTKEADTTVSLPPGIYRLDNSFTQFDGFYNLNYTSELRAEEFKISGNDAESEEEILVKIESHFITQYKNDLVIHYKNESQFPGTVTLALEGTTDLEDSRMERYQAELEEGDTEVSVHMKAGTYHVADAGLEMDGTGEEEEDWNLEYEKGDIVIRHHNNTEMDVIVSKKELEGDTQNTEEKKFSFFAVLEFLPVFIALGYGIYSFLFIRKN